VCTAGDIQDQNWLVPGEETKCMGITGERGRRGLLVCWAYIDSATCDRKGGDMLGCWVYIDIATGDRKGGAEL